MPVAEEERTQQYELLICAMHFIGDGMALHTFANDFFGLLGSSKTDAELEDMLNTEWSERWQNKQNDVSPVNRRRASDREC